MANEGRPLFFNKPTGALAPVGLDRARRLAWWDVQRTDINQKINPAADPTHSHWLHKFHLGNQFRLFYGRVVDSVAYTNCYKVQGEHGLPTMWCTMAMQSALQPMGTRQLGQLPVGVGVIFALHSSDGFGIILGVVPDAQTSSKNAVADFISQQGRSGLLVDEAHNYPLKLQNASMIIDWSAGRPLDATTEGETGHITETGLLKFLDSFMSITRVDEETGIWHFWHDQYTRIAGHNFHKFSAGSEQEELDDEGEFNSIAGVTPFYWEALGAFALDTTVSRDVPFLDWQKDADKQVFSAAEPVDDHQVAFYRLRDFTGYLGQAAKRVLSLPPVECELTGPQAVGGLHLLPDEQIHPGVFEENLALTGRYMVRTAHELIFSKYVHIPSPKQIRRPENPAGDNSENYKAAGIQGSGPAHKVVGEIETSGDDDPSQIRAAGFLDTHAFAFNWIGEHPFRYHEQDWYLPEEGALNYLDCDGTAVATPKFNELACNQYLQAPAAIPIKVDHRYEDVKYYPNHSYFALLADGGIVLGDGFGTEFKMANGSFWLTAPGDGCIQVGRSIVGLAGYDVVLRAKNSWEISATHKDGRLKAKRNLQIAATGECGGILIQSKATKPVSDFSQTGEDALLGGIVIKAADSMVGICSENVNIELSKNDGHIIIDAGLTGRIKVQSQYFERFLADDGAALDFWVAGTDVTSGSEWWQDGVLICAPVVIDDKLLVSGCGIFKETVAVTGGHIATSQDNTFGKVGKLNSSAVTSLNSQFDYFEARSAALPDIGKTELLSLEDHKNVFDVCAAEFTFRSVEQYRTEGFVLFESRWQQLARIASVVVQPWIEQDVLDTYPYPGRENLLGESFRTLDLKMYDSELGLAKDRGTGLYEEPAFPAVQAHILNENYNVII